ncbi:carbohydrate kinase [Xaviernesmea oryzae]|uniref:Carbohydrate kinase n=1 Tax=Xaviernesmea oryzae TaxID=464029 RepID=A0A1Q9ARF4_9HYPH|nr:FGGY-family carbohydrate kinase [Xaviernesmea oryzae]OLP57959.1 carbohydrate kinase [Xaviernesmea oryzae]SEL28996.1 Sugar (pentulose or hexulose) kinase [Xaviernesmea oryzae]
MPDQISRIAVIDIGKTNAKLVVVERESGAEIAARRMPNRVLTDGLYPHYDTEGLWRFILEALGAIYQETSFQAISVTTHGAAAALLDAKGGLAMPVLDYEHLYPAEIQAAYDRLRPDFAETFSPRLSGGLNLGAQLHYQKTAFPTDFERVATIVTYAQYWSGRLTGVLANEVTSLGCHTDLWRPRDGAFSSLVERLGLTDRMAPVRPAFDALGPVKPEIAAEIGLPANIPVFCGLHDSNASLLPHLMARQGAFSVVSTGTWVVSFAVSGDLDHLDPARDTLANVDALGRAVPSARFMGGREYELLSEGLAPESTDAIAAAVPDVIARGLMVLPNAAPGSGPFPGRKGGWTQADSVSNAERHAAIALYLALMTAEGLSLLGRDGPILVEGPFCANPTYLAALSGVTGAEVLALQGSTGTSAGAALLTGAIASKPEASAVAPLDIGDYAARWHKAVACLAV